MIRIILACTRAVTTLAACMILVGSRLPTHNTNTRHTIARGIFAYITVGAFVFPVVVAIALSACNASMASWRGSIASNTPITPFIGFYDIIAHFFTVITGPYTLIVAPWAESKRHTSPTYATEGVIHEL